MIKYNGQVIATNANATDITQSNYDSLSTAAKNNGTAYMVNSTDEQIIKLLYALGLIGDQTALSGIADGTVAGAVEDLYNRLGGCEFSIEEIEGVLTLTYDDDPAPSGNTPVDISELTTDDEKIDALLALIGDKSTLEATGNATIVDAILDIYDRLNGFSFEVDTTGATPVLELTRTL